MFELKEGYGLKSGCTAEQKKEIYITLINKGYSTFFKSVEEVENNFRTNLYGWSTNPYQFHDGVWSAWGGCHSKDFSYKGMLKLLNE